MVYWPATPAGRTLRSPARACPISAWHVAFAGSWISCPGAVAKIFAAENSAFSGGVPLSAEAVPTPSNGFTDLDEAGHQTVNRHRNALFGEYYFARRTFATRPLSSKPNSGWACRSRRQSIIAAVSSASMIGVPRSTSPARAGDGIHARKAGSSRASTRLTLSRCSRALSARPAASWAATCCTISSGTILRVRPVLMASTCACAARSR